MRKKIVLMFAEQVKYRFGYDYASYDAYETLQKQTQFSFTGGKIH